MEFLIGLIGAIVGVGLVIIVTFLIIYFKIKKSLKKVNVKLNSQTINNVAKSMKSAQEQEYTRIKDVMRNDKADRTKNTSRFYRF